MGDTAGNDFERERQRCIERNNKLLAELGLPKAAERLAQSSRPKKISVAPRCAKRVLSPSRRSNRLQNYPVPSYNENLVGVKESTAKKPRRQSKVMCFTARQEQYNMKQLETLGDHSKEWALFQDGYINGKRIYERENGLTCHQCRQKTLGKRTHCSQCKQRRGQFCGDCLWMRYGENVEEANANPGWVCPVCRDICNCSFCRNKKGWAPTGVMYQWVKSKGFKSVAHYLVMTFLDLSEGSCTEENEWTASQHTLGKNDHSENKAAEVRQIAVDDHQDTKQVEVRAVTTSPLQPRRSARIKLISH